MQRKVKWTIYVAIITVLIVVSKVGAETVEVENSRSPDGKLSLRVRGPEEGEPLDAAWRLRLEVVAGGKVVASYDYHGYAKYPYNAKSDNLSVLWSPSSKNFALMIRTTKRSWQIFVFSLDGKKLEPILLPSAIEIALGMLGVKEDFRVFRERPDKWTNEDTLVVRTRGDAQLGGAFIWYEIDITYSISKKAIIASKLVSKKPFRGDEF